LIYDVLLLLLSEASPPLLRLLKEIGLDIPSAAVCCSSLKLEDEDDELI